MKESYRTFQNKIIPIFFLLIFLKEKKEKNFKKKEVLRNRNLFSDLLETIKMVHEV